MASSARRGIAGSKPRSASFAPSSKNHGVGAVRDRPVEPCEPARRGIARNAGIDHVDGQSLGSECALKFHGKRIAGRKPEAGGERIAQGHDRQRALGRARGWKRRDGGGRAKRYDGGVPAAYL